MLSSKSARYRLDIELGEPMMAPSLVGIGQGKMIHLQCLSFTVPEAMLLVHVTSPTFFKVPSLSSWNIPDSVRGPDDHRYLARFKLPLTRLILSASLYFWQVIQWEQESLRWLHHVDPS